jgi:hypothetical protein
VLGSAPHVNSPGYDLILQQGDIFRLVEAKARQTLKLENLGNILRVDKVTKEVEFADDYFAKWGRRIPEEAFTEGHIQAEILINGPTSDLVRKAVLAEMGLPESTTSFLAHYIVRSDGGAQIEREVEVIIHAISQ